MEYHKYSLAKKGKGFCPKCGHECKRKTFVLYIDNETGNPLHSTVGKCDRSDNCGHHYTPKQYFADNHITFDNKRNTHHIRNQRPNPNLLSLIQSYWKNLCLITNKTNLPNGWQE